jgi:hypothetical protein
MSLEVKEGQWYESSPLYSKEANYLKIVTVGSLYGCIYYAEDKTRYWPGSINNDWLEKNWTLTTQPLWTMTIEEYNAVKDSGMFWEYYPEATGIYVTDTGRNLEKALGMMKEISKLDQEMGRYEEEVLSPIQSGIIEEVLSHKEETPKKTGGSSPNQYRKKVMLPLSSDRGQYVEVDLEVEDFVEAFQLNPNAFNCVKAWARLGVKEGTSVEYDLNKNLWFTLKEKQEKGVITKKQLWKYRQLLGLCEEI